MSGHQIRDDGPGERRRFERIDIPPTKQVLVLDSKGKKAGLLRQLGRGGFLMEPKKIYPRDSKVHHFIIHEQEEDIRIRISARVRYTDPRSAGFEFVNLDAESAVDVGIIIGKYYEAGQSRR
ncbi:MAG TPA: PilZ domain-containing protein [Verrucomicrobiae bacterium]|jgi:hypothetical protein|nr:PilZ domain-containing protein [Verrucomicrobiae bacterium]